MASTTPDSNGKILLVDDDPGLLRLLSIRLRAEQYEVEAGYDLFQSVYGDHSNFDLQTHNFSLYGARAFADFEKRVDRGLPTQLSDYAATNPAE